VKARRFAAPGFSLLSRQREPRTVAQAASLAQACDVKKLFFLSCLLLISCGFAPADVTWLTDYNAAKAKAKSDNKLMLLDFTGSDWCGYCKLMQAEIFSKPQFQEYATKNLVLVELDFPRAKPQSDEVKKQNHKLAFEYEVEGFPTLIVLSPEGKPVAIFPGYIQGGPEPLIAALEKLRKS
jgi:thioredoxin-related protein